MSGEKLHGYSHAAIHRMVLGHLEELEERVKKLEEGRRYAPPFSPNREIRDVARFGGKTSEPIGKLLDDQIEALIPELEERCKRLEDRLDAVIAVVEEIVYARWCEGKELKDVEKRALSGSLGYDRLFEGRKEMGRIVELVKYRRLVTPAKEKEGAIELWEALVDAGFDCFDFEDVFIERPCKEEGRKGEE